MVESRLNSFYKNKKILLTGGHGFLGKYVYNKLINEKDVLPENIVVPTVGQLDLRKKENCIKITKDVDILIHLAARVGGIGFNQRYPGTLFYDNIIMGVNLIEASRIAQIEKFVQVGTVCSYPKIVPTPFKETDLWNGYPEETNAPYGIAKKALLVMAHAYREQYKMNIIYLLPVNLYGPGDNFSLDSSHVIPALIKKFVDAIKRNENQVIVWGSGNASREFLYVDDAAEGIILATEKYDKPDPLNLGTGKEITIKQLVELIASLTGFHGEIIWDESKPDGQPRRCLDIRRAEMELGFMAKTDFRDGLQKTINWYMNSLY